jgi:outer membrane protein assembly factor BamB
MLHHDIWHTSHSQSTGPRDADLLWTFAGWPDFWTSASSPVIGSDRTIYIGDLGHLHAINKEGHEIWRFDTGWTDSTPAIGSDGTIYIGAWDGNLYAINPNGTEKWRFTTKAGIWLNSSPAIGENGNIYFGGNDGYLYALSDQGSYGREIWRFPTDWCIYASPAIGPDGTIYISSWDGHLYAVNPNGTEKWRFPKVGRAQVYYYEFLKDLYKPLGGGGIIDPSPSVGAEGIIYWPADFSLYALHPNNGEVIWRLDEWAFTTPSIAPDGTIYTGLFPNDIIAVNSKDGSIIWRFVTPDEVTSAPAIGSDGVIYFGCWDFNFYAVDKNGNELWHYPTGWWVIASPALYGGTIYFTSGDDNLYAIGGSQIWFEENDLAISYTGTWNTYTCPSCSGGVLKYSGISGAKADFSFNGTGIKWIVTKANMLGKAKVYLDGVYMGMVDLYSSTPKFQVVLQKTGLSYGSHKVTIEVSGQKNPNSTNYYIDIDAFDVVP